MNSNAVKLTLAIVLLVSAAAIAWYRFGNAEVDAVIIEKTHWICTASSCGKEFEFPAPDYAKIRRDSPDAVPPCPHCGTSTVVLGVPCSHCTKLVRPVGHGQLPPACPHCGKPPVAN